MLKWKYQKSDYMRKFVFFMTMLLTGSIFGGNAARADETNPLEGLAQVKEIKDLKAGGYYFLVSDRKKFNGNTTTTPKAMAAQQDYFPVKWGENYVYWADLDVTLAAFAWIAEEAGDGWAFKNVLNEKYIGNGEGGDCDVVFSDTPVGYVLDDASQIEGVDPETLTGKFLMTNSANEGLPIMVQGFGRSDRPDNALAKQKAGLDSYDEEAVTNGYPGRWLVYELTEEMKKALKTGNDDDDDTKTGLEDLTQVMYPGDVKDGKFYYIVSDRKKFAGNATGKPKAMATQQDGFTVKWGDKYVYWGDLDVESDGFVWKAEQAGDQWAFLNMENGKYLGKMNTAGGESDIIFSNTPVGHTLTDLNEGEGRFSITNSESEYSMHVQGYLRSDRPDNSLCKQSVGNDDYSSDAATEGYPGRWKLYEVSYNEDTSFKEGYYYIVNTYAKFEQPEAWMQSQLDARCATTPGAELAWNVLDEKDPRFIFKVTPTENGVTIQNYVSGQYVGGLTDDVVVMTAEPTVEQTLEAVEGAETEGTYYIFNSTLGENRMYPDSHQYGANTCGLVGGNQWWSLEENAAAKWQFQRVSNSEVEGISSEKLALAKLVTETNNPEYFAYEALNEEQTANLKAAYAAAEAGVGQTMESIFYNKLAEDLKAALKGEYNPDDDTYDKHHYDTVRVVSYNVRHCAGMDGKLSPERTAKVISGLRPTVVALQELDSVTTRSNGIDELKKLAEETGMYGVFCKSIDYAGGGYGNGVLTSEMPKSIRRVNLTSDGERRTLVLVELKDYVFGSLHVGLSAAARRGSGSIILKAAKDYVHECGKPVIIAGDFNDDGTDSEMQGARGVLCQYLERYFTFHSDRTTPTWGAGTFIIDHIISYTAQGGVETLSYEVINDKVTSDHLPIVGELRVGYAPEGIKSAVNGKKSNGLVYNLGGQVVSSENNVTELPDGIYIVDGHKRSIR